MSLWDFVYLVTGIACPCLCLHLCVIVHLCDRGLSAYNRGLCLMDCVCGQRMVPGSVVWYELRWLSLNSVPTLGVQSGRRGGCGGENKAALGRPGVLEPERGGALGWCLIICCLYAGPLGLVSLGQARGVCLHGRGQQTLGRLPGQEPGWGRTPGTWPWLCRDSACSSRRITAQPLALVLHFSRIGSLVVVLASSYQGAVKSRGVCESHVPCGVEWVKLGSYWNPPPQQRSGWLELVEGIVMGGVNG